MSSSRTSFLSEAAKRLPSLNETRVHSSKYFIDFSVLLFLHRETIPFLVPDAKVDVLLKFLNFLFFFATYIRLADDNKVPVISSLVVMPVV